MSLHHLIVPGVSGAIGICTAAVLRAQLRRLAVRHHWRSDDAVLALATFTVPWIVLIASLWAAELSLPLDATMHRDADKTMVAAVICSVTLGVARLVSEAIHMHAVRHSDTSGTATIFVAIARAAVLATGLLILLNDVGISIAPLLTALGVGGAVVGLALQDTLANVFAGLHMLISRKVEPGDFIRLDAGTEGYVTDTNWRNTTLRQLAGNFVIVPNSTLASSIMTSYHRPCIEHTLMVKAAVALGSDLDQVERITCEVAAEVESSVPGGVPGFPPCVRFDGLSVQPADPVKLNCPLASVCAP